jgi:phage replication-related protein YjqB (UPF0714/DUF867 family)
MADTYRDFATLAEHEVSGVDFKIVVRGATTAYAIVAVHGGGIEPGTSEIADATAGHEMSFYAFDGIKAQGNGILHITSTRFDEPLCLELIARCEVVVAIHGEDGGTDSAVAFLGGRDVARGASIRAALSERGFDVRCHTDPDLQGLDPRNICNRGSSGAGVQLELSRVLRRSMFKSLSREGRRQPTERFHAFVAALQAGLTAAAIPQAVRDQGV